MMRSVERVLSIFDCFTRERTSLTLQEIADRINLPKSTTYRLVDSLKKSGYLVRLDNLKYCLSFRFTLLSGLVHGTLDLRNTARPIMRELSVQTNETVTLNMISGAYRVCIEVMDAPSPLMSVTKPGERVRLGAGATAKTLIAALSKSQLRELLPSAIRESGSKRSELLRELEIIRRQGFAVSHSQIVLGLTAISAPVKSWMEEVPHAVTLAGPSVRLRPRQRSLVSLVTAAAAEISKCLGADLNGKIKQ